MKTIPKKRHVENCLKGLLLHFLKDSITQNKQKNLKLLKIKIFLYLRREIISRICRIVFFDRKLIA